MQHRSAVACASQRLERASELGTPRTLAVEIGSRTFAQRVDALEHRDRRVEPRKLLLQVALARRHG
jgi:hypothetical protein